MIFFSLRTAAGYRHQIAGLQSLFYRFLKKLSSILQHIFPRDFKSVFFAHGFQNIGVNIPNLSRSRLLIRGNQLVPGGNNRDFPRFVHGNRMHSRGGKHPNFLRPNFRAFFQEKGFFPNIFSNAHYISSRGNRIVNSNAVRIESFAVFDHDNRVGPFRNHAPCRDISALPRSDGPHRRRADSDLFHHFQKNRNTVSHTMGVG